MRLRPKEWPAPIRGELAMTYWDGAHNSSRRTLRSVSLLARACPASARPTSNRPTWWATRC